MSKHHSREQNRLYDSPLHRDEKKVVIKDVWAGNLREEFDNIMEVIELYPCVAMDTEFPGVVAKPTGSFKSNSDYHYQTLRCNVNLLKIIQIGFSFANEKGEIPENGRCCWQFHFKFDLKEDIYAQDSIELLAGSGINFDKHRDDGIDVKDFAELLTISGMVLTPDVKWISFHSAYDFGYLVNILTASPLPEREPEFFKILHIYFPFIYDIKYMMRSCEQLKGGLQHVGETVGCRRIGPAHQAGSDSLLTLDTFFQIMKIFFENDWEDRRHVGILYGLGEGWSKENDKYDSIGAKGTLQSIGFAPQKVKFRVNTHNAGNYSGNPGNDRYNNGVYPMSYRDGDKNHYTTNNMKYM